MSENLLFKQLLDLLAVPECKVLGLLVQFRRPMLPLVVEMQEPDLPKIAAALERLNGLTLAEKSTDDLGLTFYYVPALTRILLERDEALTAVLDQQKAGEYYDYVAENVTNLMTDLEEAFFHFVRAENVAEVNKMGDLLSNTLYNYSLFKQSLIVASQTYEICSEDTVSNVLNLMGLNLQHFWKVKRHYFSLKRI